MPTAKTSVRKSSGRPSTCSGAMYAGEPRSCPVTVMRSLSTICAMPKSMSLMSPSSRIMTFSGFTSRWMTPNWCACSSARATSEAIISATSGKGSGSVGEKVLERAPVDELGDDVALGRVGSRVVEDLEDVLVAQLGDGVRLALQARARLFLPGEMRMQDLDRDLAVERRVGRFVDHRHTALPHLLEQAIARESWRPIISMAAVSDPLRNLPILAPIGWVGQP